MYENGGEQRSKVVVIGGGAAGSLLAKSLQLDSNLVLIDPKEYYNIPWTYVRSMVEPEFADKTVIKHMEYLTNGSIVNSRAIDITPTEVLTEDGRVVPYDFLVIATGHDEPLPRTKIDRLEQFKQENEKIKTANSILIIGGGRTGVELAGEIVTDYPDKKIILVHDGPRLLEFAGLKASTKVMKWLKGKNVEVILNQTIDLNSLNESSNEYKTSNGTSIVADCYFFGMEKSLGSGWIRETMLKGCLDEEGRLMVDKNLRVKSHDNIFAIGDITNVKELKLGFVAQNHAKLVAKNIKSLMKGKKTSSLSTYKQIPVFVLISLGRKHGVTQFPFMTTSGHFAVTLKSKDMLVGWGRKSIGLDS